LGKSLSDARPEDNIIAIEHPIIGDRYIINTYILLNDPDHEYQYSLMKLVTIDQERLSFAMTTMNYNSKEGVRKAIRDSKDLNEDYYFDSYHEFTIEELHQYLENKGIHKIVRQQDGGD